MPRHNAAERSSYILLWVSLTKAKGIVAGLWLMNCFLRLFTLMMHHKIENQIAASSIGNWLSKRAALSDSDARRILHTLSPIGCVWDANSNSVWPESPASRYIEHDGSRWIPRPPHPPNIGRTTIVINRLSNWATKNLFVIDMWDARSSDEHGVPIFAHSRKRDDRNVILLPLPGHHDKGGKGFFQVNFADSMHYRDKAARLCWRGGLTGRALNPDTKTLGSINGVISHVLETTKKPISDAKIMHLLMQNKRYALVSQFNTSPSFDVGLSSIPKFKDIEAIPQISCYVKPSLSISEQIQSRYLFAMGGNDYASSLYWQLQSNSIVIKEDYAWETFIDCIFAGKQYWIASDISTFSIDKILSWSEENSGLVEELIAERHEIINAYMERVDPNRILRKIVEYYEECVSFS